MKRNLLRVLFFINGPVPTAEQQTEADAMVSGKVKVSFRNALFVADGDGIEKSDYVAGEVPSQYVAAGIPNFSEYSERISGKEANAKKPEETPEETAAREQREKDNSHAKQATVAQLKVALGQINIPFEENAKKAELLKLYLNRP